MRSIEQLVQKVPKDRFKGVKRPYSVEDVSLSGHVVIMALRVPKSAGGETSWNVAIAIHSL